MTIANDPILLSDALSCWLHAVLLAAGSDVETEATNMGQTEILLQRHPAGHVANSAPSHHFFEAFMLMLAINCVHQLVREEKGACTVRKVMDGER